MLISMLIWTVVTKVNFIISTSTLECTWEMKKQYSELFYYACFKDNFTPIATIQEFINIWLLWKINGLLQIFGGV